ncbi:hypothetical protein B0O99DRAFT_343947 [Bisporella sp. PMI_857]|nr:hypothetical protein B0O99DRAFT_343947 [Bisporella sp. PMI_857]
MNLESNGRHLSVEVKESVFLSRRDKEVLEGEDILVVLQRFRGSLLLPNRSEQEYGSKIYSAIRVYEAFSSTVQRSSADLRIKISRNNPRHYSWASPRLAELLSSRFWGKCRPLLNPPFVKLLVETPSLHAVSTAVCSVAMADVEFAFCL